MSGDPPDSCPVHELARTDPGATVQLYDEAGRYLGPASAERACDSHHVGAYIGRQLREALAHYVPADSPPPPPQESV